MKKKRVKNVKNCKYNLAKKKRELYNKNNHTYICNYKM